MVSKQIRFSATSALNVNISAANLETLTETIVSWGRQNDVEHKLLRKSEVMYDVNSHVTPLRFTVSAIELIICFYSFRKQLKIIVIQTI